MDSCIPKVVPFFIDFYFEVVQEQYFTWIVLFEKLYSALVNYMACF